MVVFGMDDIHIIDDYSHMNEACRVASEMTAPKQNGAHIEIRIRGNIRTIEIGEAELSDIIAKLDIREFIGNWARAIYDALEHDASK